MTNVIKLRKGLDINLKGRAEGKKVQIAKSEEYAMVPEDFPGLTPKVLVREGDHVNVGDALFANKAYPDVKFASPVSGQVTAVIRGNRRKVLCVKVKTDAEQQFVDFGKKDVSNLDGDAVKKALCEAGLFGFINQLPYAVSTNPETTPKAIFVSALTNAKDVEVNIFDGPCPAGNVGVQVNHISPVNKGEIVWTVDPSAVIFFGRLFAEGKVDMTRTIAIAGSEVTAPAYADVLVGTPIRTILEGNLKHDEHIRVINGNPLTGKKADLANDYLGAHTSEVTVIPEGDNADEMLGWILPRAKEFSTSRSYFSWLFGKKKTYELDARVKGGERHMIMSGEYDKVLPMDIYGEFLIKAIIAGDIDKQEQLGIYEVSPEDFALAEFVDSSKLELQKIVREGLNILRKENA